MQDRDPMEMLGAFARTGDGVLAVNRSMRVVECNDAAARMLGRARNEIVGRACDEVVRGFDPSGSAICGDHCRVLTCAYRGEASDSYDLVRTVAAGNKQWLNVSVAVLRGRSSRSTVVVHLLRDVTKQRAIEQRAAHIASRLRANGERPQPRNITRREADVLRLLASGFSNQAIAETLGISGTTVRNHIEHLLHKLGVHSKLEAVVFAARAGIV